MQMMREILFRAKNFDNGVWVQGYYVRLNGNKHFIYTGQSDVDCGNYYPDYYPVAAKTVGQFTGCTDKNGVKIFEGDIIQVDFQPEYIGIKSRPSYIGVVEYREGAFGIYEKGKGTQYFFQHGLIKTVIGNIYDNPELIGGADNG